MNVYYMDFGEWIVMQYKVNLFLILSKMFLYKEFDTQIKEKKEK